MKQWQTVMNLTKICGYSKFKLLSVNSAQNQKFSRHVVSKQSSSRKEIVNGLNIHKNNPGNNPLNFYHMLTKHPACSL